MKPRSMETWNAMTGERAGHPPRLFTTFKRLPAVVANSNTSFAEVIYLEGARQLRAGYLSSRPGDIFVINGDEGLISLASLLKLLSPARRGMIVAVDMVLRQPRGLRRKIRAQVRKFLWRQVDLFLHYFRDIRGFDRHYHIHSAKSDYVAFKSNLYDEASALHAEGAIEEGDYVFSAGRSLRDYQTLIEAARRCDLPFAILFTSQQDWVAHGTRVDLDNLPPNVRLIQDAGHKQGWIDGLKGARIVAIPTLPESICASGIGTCLDAMALGKAVVMTRGPGADDVLTEGQAEFVAPCDAQALAERIEALWHDDAARRALAARGQRYALGLGGEDALMRRILQQVEAHLGSTPR
jgi:glycosyltransferase involved in cell wall biosynthesis